MQMFLLRPASSRCLSLVTCPVPHADCWKCRKPLDCCKEKFFCDGCQCIQPPVKCVNFFQYLDQSVTYDVDSKELSQRFIQLQRDLHPDRFSNRSSTEQEHSNEQSTLVNKAYSTLSNPLTRAVYMLKLYGKPIAEDTGADVGAVDQEFLMDMMELNEKLADADTPEQIRQIGEDTKQTLQRLQGQVSKEFSRENVDAARQIVLRMKFFKSLQERVNERLGLG